MADIVYVSFDVLMNQFTDIADAIHGWGDFEGDEFMDDHNGPIVVQKCGDLYLISRSDLNLEQIAFRPFILREVPDFLAIFRSGD